MVKSVGERNEVEATFGTAKRVYKANNIRAKLAVTANCWTGMYYFVKNLMKFIKGLYRILFYIAVFMKNPSNLMKYQREDGYYTII